MRRICARFPIERLWPRRLAGQMILAVLVVLMLGQVTALAAFLFERHHAIRAAAVERFVGQSAAMVQLLADTPADLHGRIAESASGPLFRFSVDPEPSLEASGDDPWSRLLRRHLRDRLGGRVAYVRVDVIESRRWRHDKRHDDRHEEHGGRRRDHDRDDDHRDEHRDRRAGPRFEGLAVALGLPDGRWLNVATRLPAKGPAWARTSTIAIGVTAVLSVIAVVLIVRRATRPLARLADSAERFGRGERVPALVEEGPEDVRRTTQAFNGMRERLERFVADRTRMLAAISHDLRTPITSLRLRAELVEDADLREKLLATLAEMQEMTEATLAFAREDADAEPTREVDLAALLDSLADDLGELGPALEVVSAPDRLPYRCRPAALRRAFRNLLTNAQVHGGGGRISISAPAAGDIEVTIDDGGPGIPEQHLERVFEPFVRVEGSRSRETGGIGLGLAIARTIVHAHGGEIELANRAEGGLRQRVILPPAPRPNGSA